MATKQQLEQMLQNPNTRKFLDLISFSEGTQGNGYYTAFGGGRLSSLNDHPRYSKSFRQTNGVMNTTSAAGRYQFMRKTWDGVQRQLGLPDFSPHSQDIGALKLLDDVGALPAVAKGDYQNAVMRAGRIWASFPTAPAEYHQGKHNWQKFHNWWAGKQGATPPNRNYQDSGGQAPSFAPIAKSWAELTGQDTPQASTPQPIAKSWAELTGEDIKKPIVPVAKSWAELTKSNPLALPQAVETTPMSTPQPIAKSWAELTGQDTPQASTPPPVMSAEINVVTPAAQVSIAPAETNAVAAPQTQEQMGLGMPTINAQSIFPQILANATDLQNNRLAMA